MIVNVEDVLLKENILNNIKTNHESLFNPFEYLDILYFDLGGEA